MTRLGVFLMGYLSAQIWIGRAFSPQQGLVGRDTVFRLTGASQLLWVEYKASYRLSWDTLWVIVRTPDKIQGAFRLYRVQNNPLYYRGQVRVRTASIHIAFIVPPRQYRQILSQKRFYITDAAHPTVASLRTKAQTQIAQTQPALSADIPLEELELPSDALLTTPAETLDEKIEEPLLEDDSLEIDLPDLEGPALEEDLLDEDFGDLDDL